MNNTNVFEALLRKAKESENTYDWILAADFNQKALDLAMVESSKGAEICEQVGFCYLRAAFQASTRKNYADRLKLAVKAYERAVELYQNPVIEKKGIIDHAKAMVAYTNSWLALEPSKKRELVEEWWRLEIEALNYWENTGDRLAYGVTCANLAEGCLAVTFMIEPDWQEFKRKIEEGISYGEKAIVELSVVSDDYELARAYCWTVFYYTAAIWYRVNENRREEFGQKIINYSRKALVLSEKIGDAWLIGHSNLHAATGTWAYTADLNSTIRYFEEARKFGSIAKDKMITGMANTWLSFNTNDLMIQEENPEKQREGLKKSLEYVREAIESLHKISWYSIASIAYAAYIDGVTWLASVETNLEAKQSLFQEATKIGREGYKYCKNWVHLGPSYLLLNSLSTAIYRLSQTKSEIIEKRRLLEEALDYREKYLRVLKRVTPFDYWVRISGENYRALILAELAKIENNEVKKIKLLKKAVLSIENCLELIKKDTSGKPLGWKSPYVGFYYYSSGKILEQLFLLTKNESILEKAIDVFSSALEVYSKTNLDARVAECHWQIAKLRDRLGDNLEAARSYDSAAETYKLAGEKIPQLKDFYEDYSLYMQAWSEIENAKHYHIREDYDQSRMHYEKAANLHESSEPWSYLAPNYLAWAQMEKAEHLSRKEKTQEALQAFQQALEQFKKAEESIQTKIKQIIATDEKEMVTKLIKASDNRRRYSQARISIEEAKILDRKGENDLSSKSYGIAAEKLRKIIEETESEPAHKELKLMMVLCQAWQKMVLAEERTSPEIYMEASQLFGEAKEYSLTNRTSLLALGNSSFCKALAAGIRFQITLNVAMYSEAKGYIKSAENCYLKAGFQAASEYAKATQRLFDAYLYMNNAERETDPEKSAKYYQMAEKVLQISSGSFMKAKQPEKKAEVQRILETVKEERELAVSLSDVLHAPTVTSTTASFTTPTPTNEESVGLERFEHADVQANLIPSVHEVKVGENIGLEMEFTNAGKEPASLVKVEEMIPEGFKLVEKPDIYRVEDSYLNMKGKRLLPLKTEEVKLVLRSLNKGIFQLKPRILYLDESGNSKSCEPEPVTITVKELGISGWLKGPTK